MGIGIKAQLELLNQQLKELDGIYRDAVSRSGISEKEFWIWYSLMVLEGEHSQQEICRTWKLSKQTVNTIVAQMVRKEYASLEAVPGKRNRKVIRLTERGRAYGEQLIRPVADAELRAYGRLSVRERSVVSAVLAGYIETLKEELRGTVQPA